MTMTKISRGRDMLDTYMPNWATKINLDTFDISDCGNCIVGQLFPNDDSYFERSVLAMWEAFDIEPDEGDAYGWATEHGFDVCHELSEEMLQESWILAIKLRLG